MLELALNSVKKRLSKKINIPLEEFLASIRLVLNFTFFHLIIKFTNKFSVPR